MIAIAFRRLRSDRRAFSGGTELSVVNDAQVVLTIRTTLIRLFRPFSQNKVVLILQV